MCLLTSTSLKLTGTTSAPAACASARRAGTASMAYTFLAPLRMAQRMAHWPIGPRLPCQQSFHIPGLLCDLDIPPDTDNVALLHAGVDDGVVRGRQDVRQVYRSVRCVCASAFAGE